MALRNCIIASWYLPLAKYLAPLSASSSLRLFGSDEHPAKHAAAIANKINRLPKAELANL
jgi:hypothetical protein